MPAAKRWRDARIFTIGHSTRSLDELVLRCLAKAPDDRFRSVEELEIALQDCAAELTKTWTNEDARAYWLARAREKDEERVSMVASSGPLWRR